MACRVVPLLREICADATRMCPDAWIINYTNPTQFVADAVRRISDLKILCLCDGYIDVANDLAPLLEIDPGDVTVYPAGTNHAIWVMRFTVKGEDGYPILRERLRQVSTTDIQKLYAPPAEMEFLGIPVTYAQIYKQFVPHYQFPFSLKLFDIYGLLPAPRYYWRYLLDQDAVIEAQKSGHYVTMAGFYMKHAVPHTFKGMDERLARSSRHLHTERRKGGGGHGDLAVRVIAAMVNNRPEIFDVNISNQGAISNLPHDAIVEMAATVDGVGAHPFALGPLPKALLGMQTALVLSQELTVDAAFSGSRQELLQAILAHPLIHSMDAAEKTMDELLALQADWLPQFQK
jgi:6-phospho-beta-glucosidase